MSYKIQIEPGHVNLNGTDLTLPTNTEGGLLTALYRQYINDYPQFFKMDGLSKVAFVASELLLASVDEERFVDRDDRAIILVGVSGTLSTDKHYQETINDKSNYYPSPSLFVRTLPNIAISEIAIRNHYHGETMFLMVDETSDFWDKIRMLVSETPDVKDAICGYVSYEDENDYEAILFLKNKEEWKN